MKIKLHVKKKAVGTTEVTSLLIEAAGKGGMMISDPLDRSKLQLSKLPKVTSCTASKYVSEEYYKGNPTPLYIWCRLQGIELPCVELCHYDINTQEMQASLLEWEFIPFTGLMKGGSKAKPHLTCKEGE